MTATSHPGPEDLLLVHYGEGLPDGRREHVFGCAECQRALAELRSDLAALEELPAPEPDAGFEARVFAAVRPALRDTARARPLAARVAPWLAMAAVMVLAFLAGREFPRSPSSPTATSTPAPSEVRERVLLVAVGQHLDRTRLVLVEVMNASAEDTLPRDRAGELVASSRLYRQTAVAAGEPAVAGVLDELERVLVEIAHAPDGAPADELKSIQDRIRSRGLLLKVRVVSEGVRRREADVVAGKVES